MGKILFCDVCGKEYKEEDIPSEGYWCCDECGAERTSLLESYESVEGDNE